MTQEITPKSVATDDNFRAWFVPSGSNPLSIAVLNGALAKSLTYSLVPGGFNRDTSEESIADERLTLKVALERPGTVGEKLEVQYVFGDDGDVASVALAEGTEGFIVSRPAVPNATAATVGQKVDVLPILCGKQRKNQPTKNSVWTKTQKLYIIDVPQDDALLVA